MGFLEFRGLGMQESWPYERFRFSGFTGVLGLGRVEGLGWFKGLGVEAARLLGLA